MNIRSDRLTSVIAVRTEPEFEPETNCKPVMSRAAVPAYVRTIGTQQTPSRHGQDTGVNAILCIRRSRRSSMASMGDTKVQQFPWNTP